jgi:hypothetical protein
VAVLLQTKHHIRLVLLPERNPVFESVLTHQELLRIFEFERDFDVIGERLFIVGVEAGGDLLLELNLSGHLARPHCKLRDVLQSLTSRCLASWALYSAAILAEVVNDLKWKRVLALCLHAFEQIILISATSHLIAWLNEAAQ